MRIGKEDAETDPVRVERSLRPRRIDHADDPDAIVLEVDDVMLRVDLDRLGPVGRLMGPGYVRITDRFDMPRLSLEDWNERNSS